MTDVCWQCGAGPSVVNVYINYEKKFAFVEFRTGKPPHIISLHLYPSCPHLFLSLFKSSLDLVVYISITDNLV